jgi:hypothetical protein
MLKNQQDVEVLKLELEYLDGDFRPQQAVHEVKSFGVRPECANPKCQTECHLARRRKILSIPTRGECLGKRE